MPEITRFDQVEHEVNEVHEVERGNDVDQVPLRRSPGHEVHQVKTSKEMKRHHAWAAFTRPLCTWCLQMGHDKSYQVRYAVAAAADEVCTCPCQVAR